MAVRHSRSGHPHHGVRCFPDDPINVDTSTITVQVRDAGSSPVAGAEVTWWPADLPESEATAVGSTGTSGNVTFDVMTAWEDVRIRSRRRRG